ncbi:MAG: hypothetical protein ABJZ55_17625 [Fuerstiella sp.]
MTPSKLLLVTYLVGGCIAGSLTQTDKKPPSPQVTYGMYAYLAVLLIAGILMVRRSTKLNTLPDKPNWWSLYGNPVTAAVCFIVGFLLITVGLF